jgi:hypothetical protein
MAVAASIYMKFEDIKYSTTFFIIRHFLLFVLFKMKSNTVSSKKKERIRACLILCNTIVIILQFFILMRR